MSKVSAARLGGFSEERHTPAHEINTNVTVLPSVSTGGESESRTDYFVQKDGVAYAGTHLLVELWDATNLSDVAGTEAALCEAAEVAGATILHSYLHPFGPEMGVSGVVVLAESHISIHTWPERGYAAVDIFMCGDCNPYAAVKVLERTFAPGNIQLTEQKRGLVW